MRRFRGLAPVAAVMLLRLVGLFLGMRSGSFLERSRTSPRQPFDPQSHLAGIHFPVPSHVGRGSVFLVLALLVMIGASIYAGYEYKLIHNARARAVALTAGDPDLGRDITRRYGCAGCHMIPGIPGAQGKVGPTLQGYAARVYIGGVATNSPDALIQWIENPRSIDPKTAMPVTGISRAEARHVAA